MNNMALGKAGEDEAAGYLCKKGYIIAARNYRSRIGECDIVAYDGPTLVFAEVKSRTTDRLGLPCEAVTKRKQRNISQMALVYMQDKGIADVNVRFDVVEVRLKGKEYAINHIVNAFEYAPEIA
jgi:putative endonuclease